MLTNFRTWVNQSISFKFVVITILVLLLLIPASMIRSLIIEREYTRNQVVSEVSAKWANAQTLTGPFITIPYLEPYEKDGRVLNVKKYAHFLPSELNINGRLDPTIRYRSLYKVIVYSSELSISGKFDRPDFSKWKIQDEQILFDEATICFGITDMRGINKAIVFELDGKEFEANPGLPTRDVSISGVSSTIGKIEKDKVVFSLTLDLNGSQELNFIPIGKTTDVGLTSDWPNPSFDGSFLPDDRSISDKGFEAEWHILELNRNYPQQWIGDSYKVRESKFGLNLLFAVDLYQKSERSAKYAIMFLALTFLIFILSEIINKQRIHPIQYLLIGIALCVFYTLLISLAEQIGFNYAYLIASLSTVLLIGLYTASIVKSKKFTIYVSLALIVLYTFLFTILQLQDYALMMGSIGLFLVVAITMFLSRRIDWYGSISLQDKDSQIES